MSSNLNTVFVDGIEYLLGDQVVRVSVEDYVNWQGTEKALDDASEALVKIPNYFIPIGIGLAFMGFIFNFSTNVFLFLFALFFTAFIFQIIRLMIRNLKKKGEMEKFQRELLKGQDVPLERVSLGNESPEEMGTGNYVILSTKGIDA